MTTETLSAAIEDIMYMRPDGIIRFLPTPLWFWAVWP